jgi:hypothetical protein
MGQQSGKETFIFSIRDASSHPKEEGDKEG